MHHADDAARHADDAARHADGVARHADGKLGQADDVPSHKMALHPTRNALFYTLAATFFCIVKWLTLWNGQNFLEIVETPIKCVEWHNLCDMAEMSMKLPKPPHYGSKQPDSETSNQSLSHQLGTKRVNEQTNEQSGAHK